MGDARDNAGGKTASHPTSGRTASHPTIGYQWVAVLCLLWLAGCSPRVVTQEVPVMIHDSVRVVQTERVTDTIWQSSVVNIIDTMWLDTSTVATLGMPILHHDRTTNVSSDKQEKRSKETADTVYIEKEKPVIVTNTEIKEVNKLYWWQTMLMWLGVVAGAGGLLVAGYKLRRRRD